jgi:hypothetical protein
MFLLFLMTLGPVLGARRGESLKKIFLPSIQRNPLKRLDSDERIQRNPRISNTVRAEVWR